VILLNFKIFSKIEDTMNNHFLKKLKETVWPIENWELKKFIPMSLMMMLTVFVYTTLRSVKDALLIPVFGAETISSVKLYGVLPSAILMMLIYTKFTHIFQKEKLYYIFATFFLVFFLSYGFILYPHHEKLHVDLTHLKEKYFFLRYVILMFENWTSSLFYIFSELWCAMMLQFLFWQFANEITPITEAKRFYSLFSLLGQIGMIAAGVLVSNIARFNANNESLADPWSVTLTWIIISVSVAIIFLIYIYRWMQLYVLTDKTYYDPEVMQSYNASKTSKVKLSLKEGFIYIFSSKYLGLIALLVICYGSSINFTEGVWKSRIQQLYPTSNEYLAFMGDFYLWNALLIAICVMLGVNLTKRFRWLIPAITTPLITFVVGFLFFLFILFDTSFDNIFLYAGVSALQASVFVGAIQNSFSKAIKYAAFDPTKEIAYIPLDQELKLKGKAAVDLVGTKLGKALGAVLQWALIAFTGLELKDLTSVIFALFLIIMMSWFYAVFALSEEFEKASKRRVEE